MIKNVNKIIEVATPTRIERYGEFEYGISVEERILAGR